MNIGLTNTDTKIEISDEVRKANLAIFGIKNTGKAFTFIPSLFEQDLEDKSKGITIIVDTPELSWYLYGMCKILGRKADILKPSIKFDILNKLLFSNKWDYNEINKIYDYEKAIKEKKVTIIDMEEERYGDKSVRACSMLLLQLQSVMVKDRPRKLNYSVYIDGAADYLQYINNLLKYGDFYGFETTLFFKSREELGKNKILVDNYIRNYILLQGISYEDAKYFSERMNFGDDINKGCQEILNRNYGEIVYEILDNETFKRKIGTGKIIEFSEKQKKEFTSKGAQLKKKYKDVDTEDHHYQLEEAATALKTDKKTSYLEEIAKDVNDKEDIIETDFETTGLMDTIDMPEEVDLDDLGDISNIDPEAMFSQDDNKAENEDSEKPVEEHKSEQKHFGQNGNKNDHYKNSNNNNRQNFNNNQNNNKNNNKNDYKNDKKHNHDQKNNKDWNQKNNKDWNQQNNKNNQQNQNKFNKHHKDKVKVEFKDTKNNTGEPQLNKFIKTKNIETSEKRTDYSLLDEFDVSLKEVSKEDKQPNIEVDDEIKNDNFDSIEADFDGIDLDAEFGLPDDMPIDLPDDIELPLDGEDFPASEIPEIELESEPVKEEPVKKESKEFNLSDDDKQESFKEVNKEIGNETFSIGNKNYPYRKITNKKIERKLKDFKI